MNSERKNIFSQIESFCCLADWSDSECERQRIGSGGQARRWPRKILVGANVNNNHATSISIFLAQKLFPSLFRLRKWAVTS